MSTPLITDAVSLMTAADRCDRCGARAKVLVILHNGCELVFCSHHASVHRAALERVAVWIEDHAQPRPGVAPRYSEEFPWGPADGCGGPLP